MFWLESGLVYTHTATGLPWWATIFLLTGCARMVLFPLIVSQSKSVAKMAKIKPQMEIYTEKMKKATARGASGVQDASKAEKELHALMKAHGVSAFDPMYTAVGAFGQFPVWMTFFFTIQDIAGRETNALQWGDGGVLWWADLTTKDPFYSLPIACGATFFAMVSIGDAGQAGAKLDDKQAMMKQVMQGFAVLMPALTSWMPSGVFVYWISNNLFAMTQTLLLKTPRARHVFGLPALPSGTPILPKLRLASETTAAEAASAAPFIPEVIYTTNPNVPKRHVAPPKTSGKKKARGKKR